VKLFARNFIVFIFVLFCFNFFINSVFALTTPFRSASVVETNSLTNTSVYTNLNNCSATDGLTCDRALDTGTADLYFRDFGTYGDFGIPQGSTPTKIRIRVTGKTSTITYVGATVNNPFVWPFTTSNCQSPSDLWTLWDLLSGTIKSKLFITNVINTGTVTQTVSGYCLSSPFFENKGLRIKINGSSVSSWSANIDNLEIAFDYDPGPTPTPTPIPTPTPTPTLTPTPTPIPKTPLILIPGIGGSELKTADMKIWAEDNGHGGTFIHTYPADEKVWVNSLEAIKPGDDDYFDVLRMDNDGLTGKANLALTGTLFDGYSDTINFFTSNGYTLNKDFFLFPYDWRKDIALTAPLLDQKIQQIKTQTGSQKVDIVAHSMGGLVARNYISDATRASNVRKLFTLGTPHLGSVKFLSAIENGICLKFEVGPLCLSVATSEIKDIIQNMISGYELAPSQKYFDFYSGGDNSHPYPYKTEAGTLNYSQIKSLLTGLNFNTPLFGPSETFHTLDNSLSNTNGVDVTVIAGSGLPTLGQIVEEKRTLLLGIPYTHKDIVNINGDETVPLFSASLVDSTSGKSLLGNARVFYTNQEHGGLVASGSALKLVENILEGNSQLPDGVSLKPYSFSGTQVSVHSPVNIDVYDANNNHTGLTSDGDFEANILGSSYDTLDDAKFIFLPDNGTYTIKFEATDQGSFDFKIRKYTDDVNTSTVLYNDIPLTASTKAQTVLDTLSVQPPILQVDMDGNGTIDSNIGPTDPTTTLTPTPVPTTSSSTSTSTPTSVSSTSTPTPTPTQTIIESKETLAKSEDVNTSNQTASVAGVSAVAEKSPDKNKLYIFGLLVLGGTAILLFLKKFR